MKSHLPISLQKTIKNSPFMRNLAANAPQERKKKPITFSGSQKYHGCHEGRTLLSLLVKQVYLQVVQRESLATLLSSVSLLFSSRT